MRSIISTIILLLIIVLVSEKAFSVETVFLPNSKLLGENIDECAALFKNNSIANTIIYPDHVGLDVKDGKVYGVMFVYYDSLNLEKVEEAINSIYGEWSIKEFSGSKSNGRIWRVDPDKYSILLSKNKDGSFQLIFVQWNSPSTSTALPPR